MKTKTTINVIASPLELLVNGQRETYPASDDSAINGSFHRHDAERASKEKTTEENRGPYSNTLGEDDETSDRELVAPANDIEVDVGPRPSRTRPR